MIILSHFVLNIDLFRRIFLIVIHYTYMLDIVKIRFKIPFYSRITAKNKAQLREHRGLVLVSRAAPPATTAVDAIGNPYIWQSGDKKGQVVTWAELAKILEREKKEAEIKAKVDMKNALDKAEADKQAAIEKVKAEDKAELDAEIAEMKEKVTKAIEVS